MTGLCGLKHTQSAGAGLPQACSIANYTYTHRKTLLFLKKYKT